MKVRWVNLVKLATVTIYLGLLAFLLAPVPVVGISLRVLLILWCVVVILAQLV